MLRQLWRALLYAFGVVCTLVLLGVFLLWYFFPAEQVRQYAVATLEKHVQRPVSLGAIRLHGLGLILDDLQIADDNPQALPLLRVGSVRARLSLRHIFSGRLTIAQVAIVQPHLSLVERQGRWNLLELLAVLQQTTTPAPPEVTRPPPAEIEGFPPLPIGLELSEFLVQDVALQVQRNNHLALRVDGISVRLAGELSRHTNQLTARLTALPTTPNVTIRLESPASIQTRALLSLDVQITQQDFRTVQLSATCEFKAPDMHWENQPLPLNLRSDIAATVDLTAQILAIQQVAIHFGDASELNIQGQVTDLLTTPHLDVTLTQSRLHLADLQKPLATVMPGLTLQGSLVVPRLHLQGPAAAAASAPLQLQGSLAVEKLQIDAPGLNLRLADLNGTVANVRGTLLAYQPQELTGALEMQLRQADLSMLTLQSVHSSASFSVHGSQLSTGKLEATLQMQTLQYHHPTLAFVATALDNHMVLEGDFQAGNLDAVQLTAKAGSWLHTSLSGTVQRFGQEHLELRQDITLHLQPAHTALPVWLQEQLGHVDATGTVRASTRITGHIETTESGSLTLQTNVDVESPLLRADTLGLIKDLRGTLNLRTSYTFPDHPGTLALHGQLTMQEAQTAEGLALQRGDVAFRLHLPDPARQHEASHPELELHLQSEQFQHPHLGTTFTGLMGDVKAQLAAIRLHDLATTPLLALIRQPRAAGSIRWRKAQRTELMSEQGSLIFQAASGSEPWQQSQIDLQIQAHQVRYGADTTAATIPTLALHLRSAQELARGLLSIERLHIDAANLFSLQAEGRMSEWGEHFALQLRLSELHLAPLLAQVPAPYRAALEGYQLQGQMDASMSAHGTLPTLEDILAQRFPELDLRLHLRHLAFTAPDQPVRLRDGQATVHLTSQGSTLTLHGDLDVPHMQLTGGDATAPLRLNMVVDTSFKDGDQLRVHNYEIQFPTYGIRLQQQGQFRGFGELLARQTPLTLSTLINTLSGQLTTSLVMSTPAQLRRLLSDVEIKGSLQQHNELTLHRGSDVQTHGYWQIDNLTATYAPLVQLTDLTGTIQYRKVLTLNQAPAPGPASGSAPVLPAVTAAPRVLRDELRLYAPRRDSLVLQRLTVGPLTLSDMALDIIVKDQAVEVEHFLFNMLEGAVAGTLQLGRLASPAPDTGIHFTGEFAQLNLARLLPEGAGIAPGEGDINGNVEVLLVFPPVADQRVNLSALTLVVNITHIGKQALDRFLLFLDPLEKNPTIVNQRRLLRLATPRLVTIQVRNGVLRVNTELDTPLGRKNQPLSPIPISSLEETSFPQLGQLTERLETLRGLLQLITVQGLRVDEHGTLRLY